jgi:hypothetical protein
MLRSAGFDELAAADTGAKALAAPATFASASDSGAAAPAASTCRRVNGFDMVPLPLCQQRRVKGFPGDNPDLTASWRAGS